MTKSLGALGALAVTMLVATTANAAKLHFVSTLSPGKEVTPPTGLDAENPPKGNGRFTYDDVTKVLCGVLEIDAPLTGAPSGIHVHQAPKGQADANGSKVDKIVIPIPQDAKGAAGETFTFKAVLDDAWATSLVSGEIYGNLHTTKNPDGEVRGSLARRYLAFEVTCADLPALPLVAAAPPDADAGAKTIEDPGAGQEPEMLPADGGASAGDVGASSSQRLVPRDESGCSASSGRLQDGIPIGVVIGIAGVIARSRRRRAH